MSQIRIIDQSCVKANLDEFISKTFYSILLYNFKCTIKMKGELVQFEETEYVEKNRQFTAYKFMHAITVFQVNISFLFIFVLHKNINTRVINICLDWLRE